MTFFMYFYWYNPKFKNTQAGPVKVFDLSDNLAKQGHTVLLFAPDVGLPQKQTSARVIKIPALGIPVLGLITFNILLLLYSAVMLIKYKCDIVYVRIMSSIIPLFIAKLAKAPLFFEVNDDPYLRYANTKGLLKLKLPVITRYDRMNFFNAAKILPATDGFKNRIIEHTGLPEDRFTVLRSGSNTELFKPYDSKTMKQKLGLDPSKRYVGFQGNYNIANDYDSIINSAQTVCAEFPDVMYLIVGENWKPELLAKIKALGLENRFVHTGHVPYAAVPEYIAAIELGLAPISKSWGDISAVKIFDYLSCERPAVTSRIGSMGDYLLESGSVVFTEPEDPKSLSEAIISLLKDPAKAAHMGKEGRKLIIAKYSRQSVAEKIAQMAGEILNSKH